MWISSKGPSSRLMLPKRNKVNMNLLLCTISTQYWERHILNGSWVYLIREKMVTTTWKIRPSHLRCHSQNWNMWIVIPSLLRTLLYSAVEYTIMRLSMLRVWSSHPCMRRKLWPSRSMSRTTLEVIPNRKLYYLSTSHINQEPQSLQEIPFQWLNPSFPRI